MHNYMQKALAQNPNLLRTLLGLSFTLIFLLGYAVYGATVSPSYYVYETENTYNSYENDDPTKIYDDDSNTTTWAWSNMGKSYALDLSIGAKVKLTNSAGLYSHSKLGDSNANDFCVKNLAIKTPLMNISAQMAKMSRFIL